MEVSPRQNPTMPNQHPILAIDHGAARIGIAATDAAGILAHPVETIQVSTTDPIGRIEEIVTERQIKQIVVGLPISLNGNEGPAAIKVRKFANLLRARLPELPFYFCDEAFTTVSANEKLHEAGMHRKSKAKRQRAIIDQAAAIEILNNWLELNP